MITRIHTNKQTLKYKNKSVNQLTNSQHKRSLLCLLLLLLLSLALDLRTSFAHTNACTQREMKSFWSG